MARDRDDQVGMPWAQEKGEPEITVRGKVVRQVFANNDNSFRVVKVDVGRSDVDWWVGPMPELSEGMAVVGTGRYEPDPRRPDSERFKVSMVIPELPQTAEGLREYLASGAIPMVGPALAGRIVDAFGENTVNVLDTEPQRLLQVNGIGPKIHAVIVEAWSEKRRIAEIMMFLIGHGASPALATRIFERYGTNAIAKIQENPFRLAREVHGVGFKTADKIAQACGVSNDSPERDQAGVLEVLHEAEDDGHTYMTRVELVDQATDLLSRTGAHVLDAIAALARDHQLRLERLPLGTEVVMRTSLRALELSIVERIQRMMATPAIPLPSRDGEAPKTLDAMAAEAIASFETRSKIALAEEQRAAVRLAARSKLMILTGGPGVGKSTIVRAILYLFREAGLDVRLCAPTGRAAKRLKETTGANAMTIHRTLGYDPEIRGFLYRAEHPMDCDALIVDEVSMVDVELMCSLLEALTSRTRVIFVGDVDQLPSVGPGAVLRDLIGSEVIPTVRLVKIFRQADGSLIIENAHRINRGEFPETATAPTGEFHWFKRKEEAAAAQTVVNLATTYIPRGFGFDPRTEIQVVVPMHKGDAGTAALNVALQAELNPPGPPQIVHGDTIFRVGDKVMQRQNDAQRDVYNGDIGFVITFGRDEKERPTMVVRFDERDVLYTEKQFKQLKLAYATTIHKMQGQEATAIVVVVLKRHWVMLSRPLIYTAVTRGKKLVCLVGDPAAMKKALDETGREERKTLLAERLRGFDLSQGASR